MKINLRKLKQLIGNMPIQTKLIITTISLVLCSTLFLTLYYYTVSANLILGNSKKYILNTLSQTSKNLDHNVETVESILFDISTNKMLQHNLQSVNSNKLGEYELAQKGIDIKNILISEITKLDDVLAVFLVSEDGTVFAAKQNSYAYPDNISKEEIFASKGRNLWFETDRELNVIPIGKAVYSLSNQKSLGHIVMYLDASYMETVFEDISVTTKDDIFLVNNNKSIILGDYNRYDIINDLLEQEISKTLIVKKEINGDKKQVCLAPMVSKDWTLVSISEDESYNKKLINFRNITFLLIMIMVVFTTGLSVLIAKGISKPIRKLAKSMEQFSKGDFTVQASVKYKDEIGQLRGSFNKMVTDINVLINEVYEEKNLKQQAQIQALQMQINPHFLYNTLDTINWLALLHEANDVAEVSRSLGYLMRFSLKEDDLVSFEEELDAVENYICIQKYRYGEDLSIEINVEEEVLYEKLPRQIILPMIENTIEHGFNNIITDKKINVVGKIENETIKIRIIDNGIGITQETIEKILDGNKSSERKQGSKHMSIGINNVNQRIKLRYGEKYGVFIKSNHVGGTCVEVLIPKEEINEYDEKEEI